MKNRDNMAHGINATLTSSNYFDSWNIIEPQEDTVSLNEIKEELDTYQIGLSHEYIAVNPEFVNSALRGISSAIHTIDNNYFQNTKAEGLRQTAVNLRKKLLEKE